MKFKYLFWTRVDWRYGISEHIKELKRRYIEERKLNIDFEKAQREDYDQWQINNLRSYLSSNVSPQRPHRLLPTRERTIRDINCRGIMTLADIIAEEYNFASESALLLLLATTILSLGGRYVVKLSPDWKEPVLIYATIIKESGTIKSGLYEKVFKPIKDAEEELRLEAMAYIESSSDINDAKTTLAKWDIQKMKKKYDKDELESDEVLAELAKLKKIQRQIKAAKQYLPVLSIEEGREAGIKKLSYNTEGACLFVI